MSTFSELSNKRQRWTRFIRIGHIRMRELYSIDQVFFKLDSLLRLQDNYFIFIALISLELLHIGQSSI